MSAMLRLANVSRRFGGLVAVNDVSFELRAGEIVGLGAAGQDLATDHQERGRDNLFGSGRVGGWHDHLPAFEA